MRWQDLKNNMVVEMRNGWMLYVKTGIGMGKSVKDGLSLYHADCDGHIYKDPMNDLTKFSDTMRYGKGDDGFDIVKVFENRGQVLKVDDSSLKLLWQRSKCVEVNEKDINALEHAINKVTCDWGYEILEIERLKSLIERYDNAE